MRLLNPFFFFLAFFIPIHIVGGGDIYLENTRMLLSTIWFLSCLVFPLFFVRSRISSQECAVLLTIKTREKYGSYKKNFIIVFFLSQCVNFLFLTAILFGDANIANLRREISSFLPGSVILFTTTLSYISFVVLLVLFSKATHKTIMPSKICYFLLVFAVGLSATTGSRSASLFYLFSFGIYFYSGSNLKVSRMLIIAIFAFLVVGALSLFRIYSSENLGHIGWYISEGIIVPDQYLISSINLIIFQFRDIVIRTSEIFMNVPSVIPFQGGKSLMNGFLMSLFDDYQNPHILVHHIIFNAQSTQDAGFPPTFVSQYWFDFGTWGVVILSVLYSFISWVLFYNFSKSTTNIKWFVLYIAFLYFTLLSMYGAFEVFRLLLIAAALPFLSLFRVKIKS